jgi:hypothetical protein
MAVISALQILLRCVVPHVEVSAAASLRLRGVEESVVLARGLILALFFLIGVNVL